MAKCEDCDGDGYTVETEGEWGHTFGSSKRGCTACGGKGDDRPHSRDKFRKGSGSTGCFTYDTKVLTPTGLKNIVDLNPGDSVISVSNNGEASNQLVFKRINHVKNQIWKIQFEGEQIISTTKVHSFLLTTGWKKASEIVANDEILGAGGEKCKVRSSYLSDEYEPVYNLIIKGNYTFIAEGMQVHCFTHFRMYQMLLWNCISKTSKIINCVRGLTEFLDKTKILLSECCLR